MPEVIDSYTGQPYVAEYISKIDDIKRGRESFWRRAERERAAQQYWVSPRLSPEEGPDAAPTLPERDTRAAERVPEGWVLRRREAPLDFFPLFPTQDSAVKAMDWCVRNDGSVGVVLHWLLKGNIVPYLAMMEDIVKEVTNGK